MPSTASQLPFFVNYGAGGPASAKLVCGYLACDAQPFNPLLDNLPPVIKTGDAQNGEARWLGEFIRLARIGIGGQARRRRKRPRQAERTDVHRGGAPASRCAATRTGRLARGPARPIRRQGVVADAWRPARNWTIEELAKDVGLSRSVLAERFTDLVGMPPMQYLAKWRMQIASGLLAGGGTKIAAVAAEIGYGSEAAFSRAFKKMVGVSPSAWRPRA